MSSSSTISVTVFLNAAMLVLLCGTVHQSMAARCTCPPHYFDMYASSVTRPQMVANGIQSNLFMMGNNQSQFLPSVQEPAFKLALNMITVLYELTASTDVPILEGVSNDILRGVLNGLATDACNWVNEMISTSGITCDVQSLLQLHERLSSHENSLIARDAALSAIPPSGSIGVGNTATDRCAWINHRIFDNCRSTCTSVGATAQDDAVIYYEGKFSCSQLRDSFDDPAGDYALCSNAM